MATTRPPAKARPYSDFLTPSLHRRFTGAAAWSLLLSYAIAIWLRGPASFWSWFPIGPATIRTLLLFVCPLMIYFLRLGLVHVGTLTSPSSFQTLIHLILRAAPLQVFGWYTLSALYFCELWLWSAPESAQYELVLRGKPHERQRLNERPIFIRAMFFHAAMVQGLAHILYHYDRVKMQSSSASLAPAPLLVQLRRNLFKIGDEAFKRSLVITLSGLSVYFLLARNLAVEVHFSMVSKIYRLSQARSMGIPGLLNLSIQFWIASLFLLLIWESTNALFTIYLSQPPLKRDLPLTDGSKDPNGSLLSGLRRPREFARNMAFWELALITRKFEGRRRTIYAEFQRPDRMGGSTWTAISKLCLDEIRGITARITASEKPAAPPLPQPATDMQIQSLPRISQPVSKENVWQRPPPPKGDLDGVVDTVGKFARAHGNSPGAPAVLTPRARKLLEQGVDRLMTSEQRAQFKRGAIRERVTGLFADFLRLPYVGPLFRQTFARGATSIVCGSPYSRTGTIISAVEALTQLAVHSLKEDAHGCIQGNVLEIFRCFVTTIKAIENFLKSAPPHWTDVMFEEGQREDVAEVDEIVEALKAGLGELLLAFGEYMGYLGADGNEVREAKELTKEWQERYDMQQRLERLKTSK